MEISRNAARRTLDHLKQYQEKSTESRSTQNIDSYSDALGSLEAMEQSIMQHIRTGGLKKNRECAIIDEILNLRKNRRQLFSNIVRDVNSLNEYSLTVEQALANEREYTTTRSTNTEIALKDDVARLSNEIKQINDSHKIQIDELRESSRKSIAIEVAQVKLKYENKLRLLEEKVFAIQTASKESNEEQAKKLAQYGSSEAVIEEQSKTVQRYKEALRAMVDRENSLESENKDLLRRLKLCEDQKR